MCICINCIYVHQCSTYQFVTIQHGNNNLKHSDNFRFEPSYSILHANYIETNQGLQIDWDVTECLSFLEQPGSWENDTVNVRL